jgi:hypothetical protein
MTGAVTYRIEHSKSKREPFGSYRYSIFKDDSLIAYYWHDYRGDEHGIEFLDGRTEESPVGRMIDFIQGGGPEPLALSERAVVYLEASLKGDRESK